jgi:hypothetical protein
LNQIGDSVTESRIHRSFLSTPTQTVVALSRSSVPRTLARTFIRTSIKSSSKEIFETMIRDRCYDSKNSSAEKFGEQFGEQFGVFSLKLQLFCPKI